MDDVTAHERNGKAKGYRPGATPKTNFHQLSDTTPDIPHAFFKWTLE